MKEMKPDCLYLEHLRRLLKANVESIYSGSYLGDNATASQRCKRKDLGLCALCLGRSEVFCPTGQFDARFLTPCTNLSKYI